MLSDIVSGGALNSRAGTAKCPGGKEVTNDLGPGLFVGLYAGLAHSGGLGGFHSHGA
jgi:hypothetical protein